MHIPKTAGSTLDRIIEREYDRAAVWRLYGDLDEGLAALRSLGDLDQRAIRAVVGHFGMGLADELPGASAYLTILRDPLERIISHYHYVKARPEDRGHAPLEGVRSLEEYVTASAVRVDRQRRPGAAARIAHREAVTPADDATLARALAALDRDDVVVGVQDRFDEFVLLALPCVRVGVAHVSPRERRCRDVLVPRSFPSRRSR